MNIKSSFVQLLVPPIASLAKFQIFAETKNSTQIFSKSVFWFPLQLKNLTYANLFLTA